ncbi:MAG: molybdopterin-dependent oxidoreductase, partial [Minwuiales bacterium]|nr:molybdopterin-dependent oxidoreductase [Minwuiales bacterium]
MNVAEIASTPTEKYGVGQPVSRTEDPRLITGRGRYTDDINLANQAYGYVVRSQYAHGTITGIDIEAANAAPGVLAVYTGADLDRAGYGSMPCALPLKSHDGKPLVVPPHRPFAVGRVRYVGDPIALVVAETPAAAKDGAEAVLADIEPLPAVPDIDAALAADSPTIWDEAPGNVALDWQGGDVEAVEKAFAEAAHVTRLSLTNNRAVVAPMEPRAAIAEYDAASQRFTLHVGCQGVFGLRQSLANAIMKIEPERLRVRTYDVGGSFGMKAGAYPEYVALLHGARELGRPIKWCDERTGSFLSDLHGRDSKVEAELALAEDGTFLATRVIGAANMGAYISNFGAMIPSANIVKNMPSVYRTPLIAVATKCVFTNTTPVTAYRGAGRPEANYFMERLVDAAARETGRDPIELRRQNMIEPGQIPFTAASGQVYDSGDFEAVEKAFAEAAHVTKLGLTNNRAVVVPMEPRAAIAEYDSGSERFTLHVGCQGVFGLRQSLANAIMKIEPERLRV